MSHPANYVIREKGKMRLFYAPWGAQTVAQDMFWGPEYARRYITHLQAVSPNQFLDDLWGEGGVALDFDQRIITFFGDDGVLCTSDAVHPGFLALMREVWGGSGWKVEWAMAGMPAIAVAVGLDPSIAISSPHPPTAIPLSEVGKKLREGKLAGRTLISIVGDDGTDHRVSDVIAAAMLANGSSVLRVLEDLPSLDDYMLRWKPTEFDDYEWQLDDDLTSSIIIWPTQKRIYFRELTGDMSVIGFLERQWPEWTMRRFYGELDTHTKMIEDPNWESKRLLLQFMPSLPSDDAYIDQIAAILLAPEPEELLTMFSDSEVSEELEEPLLPDQETRQQIFSKALSAVYARRLSIPG